MNILIHWILFFSQITVGGLRWRDSGWANSLNQFDNHKVHRITFSPLLLDKLSRFCKAQIMKESSAIFSKHSTCVVKMFIKSRMCLYETRRQQGTVSWVAKRIDYLWWVGVYSCVCMWSKGEGLPSPNLFS